ncbi:MFS transporter, partial [Jiulongibacter sediminis]
FAIITMIIAASFVQLMLLSILLGLGTAVVYPTFLAAIADYTHPEQRANSIGVFRLWRDLGYAIGAIITGIIADIWGILPSIGLIGSLTIVSSFILLFRMNTSLEKEDIIN